jgi:hypothetical protein
MRDTLNIARRTLLQIQKSGDTLAKAALLLIQATITLRIDVNLG